MFKRSGYEESCLLFVPTRKAENDLCGEFVKEIIWLS